MKKLFWKLYYVFYTPVTKYEILLSYCRINGYNYNDLAISAYTPDDLRKRDHNALH